MKTLTLVLLFTLLSCAELPQRGPSSLPEVKVAVLSLDQSSVQIFPHEIENGILKFYFFLQFRDTEGSFIDSDMSKVTVRSKTGKNLNFTYEKVNIGRYYILLREPELSTMKEVTFWLGNKPLGPLLKVTSGIPNENNTSITFMDISSKYMLFRLKLADKENHPIDVSIPPEIILEGMGDVRDLICIEKGVWEFKLLYPEVNQVLYFSVRAQGAYFPMIYRYQYVHK